MQTPTWPGPGLNHKTKPPRQLFNHCIHNHSTADMEMQDCHMTGRGALGMGTSAQAFYGQMTYFWWIFLKKMHGAVAAPMPAHWEGRELWASWRMSHPQTDRWTLPRMKTCSWFPEPSWKKTTFFPPGVGKRRKTESVLSSFYLAILF